MLTTSRNAVTLDDYNVAISPRRTQTQTEVELPAGTNSYYQNQPISDNSEYNLEEITRKILGDSPVLPPEYDEVAKQQPGAAPTVKTLGSVDESLIDKSMFYTQNSQVAIKTRSLTNVQLKIAISSFAVIVLALAIVIALIAVGVGNSFGRVVTLSGQTTNTNTTVSTLLEELSVVNEAEILQRAALLGYTEPNSNNTKDFSIPKLRPSIQYNVQSNWFDVLCDNLSRFFGG
ncbi:MAG: hypothetical protein RR248_02865 [Clostridia bacterium]